MAVGGSGVEALFYVGPIIPGDLAQWQSPGVLQDSGISTTGGGGGGSSVPSYTFLSSNVVFDTAATGTLIGNLSIIGFTTGSTFSIIYNPNNLFALNGTSLITNVMLTSTFDGPQPIVIQGMNNGMYNYGYDIFVIPPVNTINFLFNYAKNSHYLGIV